MTKLTEKEQVTLMPILSYLERAETLTLLDSLGIEVYSDKESKTRLPIHEIFLNIAKVWQKD